MYSLDPRRQSVMEVVENGDESSCSPPAWWEVAIFRLLNAAMVVFFTAAAGQMKEDDNSCHFIPTYLVPAFLSLTVAIRPQLSGDDRRPGCCWTSS